MAGVNLSRRVLGAVLAGLGIAGWVLTIIMVFSLPYSLYEDDALVAAVVASGVVTVVGGLLMGLWN
ncbi:SepZ protein [Sulfurisphaera ohwakuensis]|uniref:SepZ protein n=1 Tax=Sulfurisphaera ohwakuensis TaxID=69656 RepID=UPI0036F41E0C